ncbi:MAG: hypothetical protein M1829_000621 [Trizodia sp. TS-e1964]|nr:MAG: hypothetical protein M1829_000621 [Trizodia sp. TS-e1964]
MASRVEEVQSYLDIREMNGYTTTYTTFYQAPTELSTIRVMVYLGTPENPQFVGPQDPQDLARWIWQSRGPSGENKDYLFKLEQSLKTLSEESGDEHVEDLARRVRALNAREKDVI